MRLIFLNRFFWPDHSATSQLLSDLAFHLADRGEKVTVVTSRLRYDDVASELSPTEQVSGLTVIRVWSTRFGRRGLVGRALDYASFYASAFVFLLLRCRPGDVVVSKTDPPLLSVLAAVVARARRIRRVNWLQDLFPEVAQAAGIGLARGIPGRLARHLRDWSLRGATNVALGEGMASFIRARCPAARLEVVANWADGTAIRPCATDANPLRAAWGLESRFIAGYSGNLGRVHEADTFLSAAERLRNERGVVLLFIGGGTESERLRREVERRGLDNVVFRPYQPRERLGETLTLPDVHLVSLRPQFEGLVVPSKYYGIAAAGRACIFIGDPHGEIARLIREGQCGLSVLPGDGEGLAKAILNLRDNPARLARLGTAARSQFDSRFDQRIALASWEALLRSV